jgi:outer membrane protein TolC
MKGNKTNLTGSLFLVFFLFFSDGRAQDKQIILTLDDVISLAKKQSPQSLIAKHSFRASYWRYRTHEAKFLPSLSLQATVPDLNRSISKITLEDGDKFVERKQMDSYAGVSINQNIGWTGGNIFITSDIQRIDLFGDSTLTSYMSTPVSIGFRQPILAYNSFKWEKIIEPLVYQEAMKNYLEITEQISITAINYFFDLSLAQLNLSIAKINFANADTLYKISQGRFNIGTIAQNELLQMELSYLNSQSALREAKLDLEVKKFRLRSYLGFNESVDILLIVPNNIPAFEIDVKKATAEALNNNPDIIAYDRQVIEAERDVEKAKSESRLNADLYATYGLTQSSVQFSDVYNNPQDQQKVTIGISMPIIDWGLGRGKVRMARSSQEVINTQVAQNKIDFEQDIFLKVMQFNLQHDQVVIAAKADTIAQYRYDVSKERFLIGKIDVLELNTALSDKDVNKRNYISALRNFWNFYYTIRKITLFDFVNDIPLSQDFEKLLD